MDMALKRRLNLVAWVAAAGVAGLWGTCRGGVIEAQGIGFAPPLLVSPMEAGRLKAVSVGLHGDVTEAQIVAELDPEPLLEEQAILQAQLQAMQAQASEVAKSTSRQFAQGLESNLVNRARVNTQLRADEALARALRERVTRERAVAEAGAGARSVADDLERELRVVEARLSAARTELAIADLAAKNAEARKGDAPAVNDWQAETVNRQLAQLDGRLKRLRLASAMEGEVSAIYARPGDWVEPGTPVLRIQAHETREVVGWLAVEQAAGLEVGDTAAVVRPSGEVLTGTLASVASGPTEKPAQLWLDPQRTEWAISVRITLTDGAVGPDERVTLRL